MIPDHENNVEVDLALKEGTPECMGDREDRENRENVLSGIEEAGYLELFIGPMFSGKSRKLCHVLSHNADVYSYMNVLCVNSHDDTRTQGDEKVSPHGSDTRLSPKVTAIKSKTLREVDVTNFDIIGIDESQFFEDLIEMVELWVTHLHKVVYCAGLDGDRFRKQFGYTLQLIPLANRVTKFNAKCQVCKDIVKSKGGKPKRSDVLDAPFTAGLSTTKTQKLIGGADLYVPMCRAHYEQHMTSSP